MSFASYRDALISAIETGRLNHVPRPDQEQKNHLASRKISSADVVGLLRSVVQGTQYGVDPHDRLPRTMVHKFYPVRNRVTWYIKVYFRNSSVWMESCHPSDRQM